jgi:hypothetical protein
MIVPPGPDFIEPVRPAFIMLSHDAIANRAYELYSDRGMEEGSADDDWHRAVAELKGRPVPVVRSSPRGSCE